MFPTPVNPPAGHTVTSPGRDPISYGQILARKAMRRYVIGGCAIIASFMDMAYGSPGLGGPGFYATAALVSLIPLGITAF